MTNEYMSKIIDINVRSKLGEGIFIYNDPITNLETIYWVDILGDKLYEYYPEISKLSIVDITYLKLGGYPSCIIPVNKTSNKTYNNNKTNNKTNDVKSNQKLFLLSNKHSLVLWDMTYNCIIERISDRLPDANLRFNDGKCDSSGRLWIGTMDVDNSPKKGALYSLSTEIDKANNSVWNLNFKIKGVSISNGLGWSGDDKYMYFIDTPERSIQVYRYNSDTGNIDKPVLKTIDLSKYQGFPDGMTVDNQGYIWVAMWDGYSILRIDPNTESCVFRATLTIPRPTNIAISTKCPGRIYVTSAMEMDVSESGYLLQIDTKLDMLSSKSNCFNY